MSGSTRREFSRELLGSGLVSIASAACEEAPSGPGPKVLPRRDWQPAYLQLESSGELASRARALYDIYSRCRLCPRQCGVNRIANELGVCRSGSRVKVAAAHPHFGEERPLVGRGGSGTIFFSRCNLLCVYCQNWQISHRGDGSFVSDEQLAKLMTDLQDRGCHNINLVTPTHFVPGIVRALRIAIARGLRLPVVYNCSGYEPVEILKLLDGIVDVYLPDFKYADGAVAAKYSPGAEDYPEIARAALIEMHRQVGDLLVDERGIALRGLIVRHLVLPNNLAGTDAFVKFVAEKPGKATFVNIMPQYRPEYRAREFPELARRPGYGEYSQALRWAREAGLVNIEL